MNPIQPNLDAEVLKKALESIYTSELAKKYTQTGKKGYKKTQAVKITVPSANANLYWEADSRLELNIIDGFFLNYADQLAHLGSAVSLTVNNEEIFPDKELFPVSNICSVTGVAIDDLPYRFELEVNNSKLKGYYQDGGHATAYPYSVWLMFSARLFK